MSPRPHEGPAEGGLSSSLLEIVHDEERVHRLRAVLGGFCHRCRNSLNGIKMSLYLCRRESRAPMPDGWDEVEAVYRQVEHVFDHLQSIYRPMTIARVRSSLHDFLQGHIPKWRTWYESRGLVVQMDPPSCEVSGDFDPAHLGVGLDAMATWRAEMGRPEIRTHVGWGLNDGYLEIRWQEVKAGGPPGSSDRAGKAGRRDAGKRPPLADALALPLLARIVARHGGRLEFEPGAHFGVRLRWPQYHRGEHESVA